MKIEPRIEDDNFMLAWVSLSHAATRMTQGLEDAFQAELGISLAEQDLIKQIAVNDGLTLTELARRIFFSKAGITKMLDRLEAQSLLRREADPDDRRALRAVLTAKGKRTLTKSRAILRAYLEDHFAAHLSDRNVKQLNQALRALLEGLDVWDKQIDHLKGNPHD